MTCRFLSSDLYEHHECMHWDYLMAEYYLGYGILARYLIPEWAYAIYGPES